MGKYNIDYSKMIMDLDECSTKEEIINVYRQYGIYTTTESTKTANANDLYIKFSDGSHFKYGKRTIALYTFPSVACMSCFSMLTFKEIKGDGPRTRRVTLKKNPENMELIMSFFLKEKENWLPEFWSIFEAVNE